MIIIIFGLGNPERKFKETRHNLGKDIVNLLQKKWGFSDWQRKEKLNAEISKGNFAGKEILLAKSLTFMNESGKPAKKIISNLKSQISNLWTVHDDIDLPLGKIRISVNRGPAGHKGIQSIINELGTKDFVRFRIGIKSKNREQKTMNKEQRTKNNIENFVLGKFNKEEEKIVKEVIKKTVEAIEVAIKEGVEKAMQKFNI